MNDLRLQVQHCPFSPSTVARGKPGIFKPTWIWNQVFGAPLFFWKMFVGWIPGQMPTTKHWGNLPDAYHLFLDDHHNNFHNNDHFHNHHCFLSHDNLHYHDHFHDQHNFHQQENFQMHDNFHNHDHFHNYDNYDHQDQ